MKIRDKNQLSLLEWAPPDVTLAFDAQLIKGNSFESILARGISITLNESRHSRAEIAGKMSAILDKPVSLNMLNAYASPMREGHQMSVVRFNALIHATKDRRLLEFMAEPHGWAVIGREHLPLIELAAISEHKNRLVKREHSLRRGLSRGRGQL